MNSDNNLKEIIQKYAQVFPQAWRKYLKKIESSEIWLPMNEAEMQCMLFSECLLEMKEKNLDKPFQIFAEDREITKGKRADISLGKLEDGRFVVVELKSFPEYQPVENDIKKLLEYVNKNVMYGYFGMIAYRKYNYKENIDLDCLGILEDSQHSFYEWHEMDLSYLDEKIETLLVGMIRNSRSSESE